MENEDGMILFADGNILHVGKLKIEEPKPLKNELTKSFSFSCKVDDDAGLRQLFRETSDGVDVMYMVCGTTERRYLRYPRKIKKAMKKLTLPDQRMTRLMNKLMIKGL